MQSSKYLMFLGAGLLSVSSLAVAEDAGNGFDVSGNIAFTTDYRFRGISQTDNDFALQGGFDIAHETGLYVGAWASNIDNFNSNPIDGTSGSQAEVDIYAGYGMEVAPGLALDFNVLYYYYPGASTAGGQNEIDFVEFTPGISYENDAFSSSFSVSYSPDYFFESGDSFYYNLNGGVPISDSGVSLDLHAGYQAIDKNAEFGTRDYYDWSIGFSTSFFKLDWSVAYVDTNLDDNDCFGGSDLCEETFVFTVAKSL